MSLLDLVNAQRKSDKKSDSQIITEMSYPTGFLPLDYANGVRVTSYDKYDRVIQHTDLIGFVAGTKNTIVGLPGTGKSALAVEMASSGVHKFGNNSLVHHADIENATTMQRIMKLLQLPPSLLKSTYEIYRDKAAEHIIDQFKTHCLVKLANRKAFTYDTGVLDLYGTEIRELYPSALLIDSFAMFKSGEVDLASKDVKDVTHNMIAAQAAKFNKGVLSQMLDMGKKSNVSIMSVNHLNVNVSTGFMPKPSQHMYLSQDETMPSGQATLYLANNILKLKLLSKWNHDKPEKWEYGIPGFLIETRLLKSRTNASNVPIEMVFDQRRGGFSKSLTLLHYAHLNDVLQGSDRALYVPGNIGTKFTRKTFEKALYKDPDLLEALYEACLPHLQAMLSTDAGRMSSPETETERLDAMYSVLEGHEKDVQSYRKQGMVNDKGWTDF
jgi:hypothetical protein